MKKLLELFIAFFRIGGLTFGGGYAMLPMMQKELVDKYHWTTNEELLDYYAVGQCTPGVIAVNTATFVGYHTAGIAGAAAATLGVVFPSLVIIMIIAAFLQNFASIAIVQKAFSGIRVAVAALIVNAIVKLWKTGVVDKPTLVIFLAVFGLSVIFGLSPIWFVVGSAVLGILIQKKRGQC